MNLQWMMGIGLCVALTPACSKDEENATGSSDEATTSTSSKLEGAEPVAKKAQRPEVVLLDAPVERRLYSDRIEASSFAWGNSNRFHENYHPNYLMDGDPVTTWLEDAPGNGFGYDPVFYHPPSGKCFSEMTVGEKNLVSHRGLALQEARTLIIERLNRPTG